MMPFFLDPKMDSDIEIQLSPKFFHQLMYRYLDMYIVSRRYTKTVVSIQMSAQKYNPELPLTAQTNADLRITDLVDRLGRMKRVSWTGKLT